MALDRVVRFDGNAPSKADLERLVRNFFGEGTTTAIEWDKDALYVSLPGRLTWAFAGLIDSPREQVFAEDDRARWIEVWRGSDVVYVTTRQMDEYTNVLAKGIAAMIARFWDGMEAGA